LERNFDYQSMGARNLANEDESTAHAIYGMALSLYCTITLVVWFKNLKQQQQSRKYNSQNLVVKETILDHLGYLAWFICCAGFSVHIWLNKFSNTSNEKFNYQILYSGYLICQAVVALGHLTTLIPLQFLGEILAGVAYHLLFLTYAKFIPPYHISSICIFTLFCCTSIVLFTAFLKYYIPGVNSATYLQTEELCDQFYLTGAVLGLVTLIRVYLDTQNPVIYRAVFAGLLGALNIFWPKIFPPRYYKLLSRLSDCILYVPWVVFAVEELDKITKL